MINYLFGLFFIVGIVYSMINGVNITTVMLNSSIKSIELIFSIMPIMCLWLGIVNIAKRSDLLDRLSSYLKPLLKPLFPELSKNSEAFNYISLNIVMNALGVGNAATPFGLKAIEIMQEENKQKDSASRSMITFLVMNTAAVTIIPTTIISIRILNNSINPLSIIPYIIVTSTLSCIIGLLIDRLYYLVIRHE